MIIIESLPKPIKSKVRMNSFRRNRQTRAHKESGGWVESPGNMELYKKTIWDLTTVGERNGHVGLEVTHVRVANLEGETKVYVWPTDRNDPEALEIKQSGGKHRLNLGMFLEECGLALPVRTRERFRLEIVSDTETPEGVPNALMFDLSTPLEQRQIKVKKEAKKSQPQESPARQSAASEEKA